MTGLFKKTPEDRARKERIAKKKNVRKLVKNKKYQEALKIAQDYLREAPHDHDILFIVGSIHYLAGRYDTALSYFDRTLEIAEYDTEALLLKANAHYFLGQKKRVRECCTRILQVDEKNKGARELAAKLDL